MKIKISRQAAINYFLPALLLLIVGTYSATKAVHTYALGSDALVYTYLLDGAKPGQIVLPGQHANILKLPFFWLTSLFPYNYHSFMIASILLVLVSIGLWTWLLIKLFGKRYSVLIMLLMSALVFSSTAFSINIAENTIRNIEFPIALWFIMTVNDVLKGKPFGRRQKRLALASSLLYALLLSGDNYFLLVCSLPLLVIAGWYWIQSQRFTRPMINAALLVLGTAIAGFAFKAFLNMTHLVVINQHIIFGTNVVSAENLGPSLLTAGSQLLKLHGAYIFGQTASLHSLSLFINFVLMVIGIIGLIMILFVYGRSFRTQKDITRDNGVVFGTLALGFFMAFAVYVVSGQVVQRLNGQVMSLEQERYIAIMPLLSMVGFIWIIARYYRNHGRLIGLVALVLLIQIITVYPSIRNTYTAQINSYTPFKTVLVEQAKYLKQKGIHTALTGYWDGSPLRFTSNDSISFATIVNCNHPFTFNVRKDWYKPASHNTKTALIIDRSGPDESYWVCSDQQLRQIYGTPVETKQIGQTSVWTYNYDIREKLTPYALTYY